jgi:hypothetical protein
LFLCGIMGSLLFLQVGRVVSAGGAGVGLKIVGRMSNNVAVMSRDIKVL